MVDVDGVEFPIVVRWDDGEEECFESLEDFIYSVEDFHSDLMPGCIVLDAKKREIFVKLSLMRLDEFRPKC